MADAAQGKKVSRSTRVPGRGRRPTVTFRCHPDLQAKLQQSADEDSRSLSEEIERRLERSFDSGEITAMFLEHASRSTADVAVTFLSSSFGGAQNLQAGKDFALYLAKYRAGLPDDFCEDDENRDAFASKCADFGRAIGIMTFIREGFDRALERKGEILPGSCSAADRHAPYIEDLRDDVRDAVSVQEVQKVVRDRLEMAAERERADEARRDALRKPKE